MVPLLRLLNMNTNLGLGEYKSNTSLLHVLQPVTTITCKLVSRNVYTYLHKHFTFPFGGVVWSCAHALVPPVD